MYEKKEISPVKATDLLVFGQIYKYIELNEIAYCRCKIMKDFLQNISRHLFGFIYDFKRSL